MREDNYVAIMKFETIGHFHRFDKIFGSLSRYGTQAVKPQVDNSTSMESLHTIATIGDSILNNDVSVKFKRRDMRTLGLDLKYNSVRHVLTISLQYKIVQACDKPSICHYLTDTTETTATVRRPRDQPLVTQNLETPFSSTIIQDIEFISNEVRYSVNKTYEVNDVTVTCKVVESDNIDIIDGTEHDLNINEANNLTLNYFNTL